MSRPKKQPSIENQMEAIVMQAMAEKRWELANALIDLLRDDLSAHKKIVEIPVARELLTMPKEE